MERKRFYPEEMDKIGPAHNEVLYEQKESIVIESNDKKLTSKMSAIFLSHCFLYP